MEQTALIYTMVLMSAADSRMTDAELRTIGDIVRTLPAFRDYDLDELTKAAEDCAEILGQDDGLENAMGIISSALHGRVRELAYELACEIAAVDGKVSQEEARLLEMLRHRLDVGRLVAAAIERGVRARYTRLS